MLFSAKVVFFLKNNKIICKENYVKVNKLTSKRVDKKFLECNEKTSCLVNAGNTKTIKTT